MGEKHDSNGSPRAARAASDARSWHRGDNPQVKPPHCLRGRWSKRHGRPGNDGTREPDHRPRGDRRGRRTGG